MPRRSEHRLRTSRNPLCAPCHNWAGHNQGKCQNGENGIIGKNDMLMIWFFCDVQNTNIEPTRNTKILQKNKRFMKYIAHISNNSYDKISLSESLCKISGTKYFFVKNLTPFWAPSFLWRS